MPPTAIKNIYTYRLSVRRRAIGQQLPVTGEAISPLFFRPARVCVPNHPFLKRPAWILNRKHLNLSKSPLRKRNFSLVNYHLSLVTGLWPPASSVSGLGPASGPASPYAQARTILFRCPLCPVSRNRRARKPVFRSSA